MKKSLKEDVIDRLLDFTGRTNVPTFGDSTWITDFELDSLALFHFLLHLENVLQFRFTEDDFSLIGIESFDSLTETVRMRLSQV